MQIKKSKNSNFRCSMSWRLFCSCAWGFCCQRVEQLIALCNWMMFECNWQTEINSHDPLQMMCWLVIVIIDLSLVTSCDRATNSFWPWTDDAMHDSLFHCCIFKTIPHLSFEGPLGAVLLLQHMLNKKHWSSSLSRSVSLVSHWHIKNLRTRGFNLVSCDVWAADGLGSGHPTKHEPYWYHHPSTAVLTLPTKEVPDRNVQIQRSPTKIAHSSYMHTG